MKLPLTPPPLDPIWTGLVRSQATAKLAQLWSARPTTDKGEYVHWDKLRHLEPAEGLTHEEWWLFLKTARRTVSRALPFVDKQNRPFSYALVDTLLERLHQIDRDAGRMIGTGEPLLSTHTRDTYLASSLIEESITSSQLEGASTTANVAKEMLREGRKPMDHSERMIFNNYQAMQFIREMKGEPLSVSLILELHRILTDGTLEDPGAAGRLRKTTDDIHVVDATHTQVLHTPPDAKLLPVRMKALCQFANAGADDKPFVHPVVRAILLHFMLAYDHPFVDGNGRVARALFYWSMSRQNYLLMEFISISSIIKQAPGQYGRAFLHTETDDNDTTYFLLHQLDVITRAIDALYEYLERKAREIRSTEQILRSSPKLRGKLNHRQIALLSHALKHPSAHYRIEGHRQSHNVTYDTARTDLLALANLRLLSKQKVGKAFVFVAPADLKQRIEKLR